MARLSDDDARRIAMRASDAAMEAVDSFNCRLFHELPGEWDRVADDIAEGFYRVLRAVELP